MAPMLITGASAMLRVVWERERGRERVGEGEGRGRESYQPHP